MGVNSLILLPPDARIGDVAQVIGILAGLQPEKQPLDGWGYSCRVPGASVEATSIPKIANIIIRGDLIDGESEHSATWHWEPDRCSSGYRLLYPKSSAFWIAVGRRLVDFFGGSIVYSDCTGNKPDYAAKKPRRVNNPNEGRPWHNFQNEKLNIKAISQSELDAANRWSAYKMEKTTT